MLCVATFLQGWRPPESSCRRVEGTVPGQVRRAGSSRSACPPGKMETSLQPELLVKCPQNNTASLCCSHFPNWFHVSRQTINVELFGCIKMLYCYYCCCHCHCYCYYVKVCFVLALYFFACPVVWAQHILCNEPQQVQCRLSNMLAQNYCTVSWWSYWQWNYKHSPALLLTSYPLIQKKHNSQVSV